jgi:hypothetical protein
MCTTIHATHRSSKARIEKKKEKRKEKRKEHGDATTVNRSHVIHTTNLKSVRNKKEHSTPSKTASTKTTTK